MADPQAATLTRLRNIQARNGKTIAELHAVLAASGLAKTGERRSLLMEQVELGYGDAKAPLCALHEAVIQRVQGFGEFEQAPKKAYVSLRRKKQFAMVGATTDQIAPLLG